MSHFLQGAFHGWTKIDISCLGRHHQFLFKISDISILSLISASARDVKSLVRLACHKALVSESKVNGLIIVPTTRKHWEIGWNDNLPRFRCMPHERRVTATSCSQSIRFLYSAVIGSTAFEGIVDVWAAILIKNINCVRVLFSTYARPCR